MGEEKAERDNAGKVRLHLLPRDALVSVAHVFEFGCQKYDKDNWKKGQPSSVLFDSTERHLWAWWNGEDYDDESGMLHLTHAGWNILVLIAQRLRGIGEDDRCP